MNVSDIMRTYAASIVAASKLYAIPQIIIAAIIARESGGNPSAIGDDGLAKGLMQMHPNAAKDIGADWRQLDDPAYAIDAGTRYLARQMKLLNSKNLLWAISAYNQGARGMALSPRQELGFTYADDVLQLARECLEEHKDILT